MGCDDPQPGLVEAHLTDARDQEWVFVDKAPIFEVHPITRYTAFPVRGAIRCHLIGRSTGDGGLPLAKIHAVDTAAEGGIADFEVRVDALDSSDISLR
jgi:hypothetical protein